MLSLAFHVVLQEKLWLWYLVPHKGKNKSFYLQMPFNPDLQLSHRDGAGGTLSSYNIQVGVSTSECKL